MEVLARDIRPTKNPADTEVVATAGSQQGHWIVEVPQDRVDVRLLLRDRESGWQSIDAPSRRAGSERACQYGSGQQFVVRVVALNWTNHPDGFVVPIRIWFAPSDPEDEPYATECRETRAATEHLAWSDELVTQQHELYLTAARRWQMLGDSQRSVIATLRAAWLVLRRKNDSRTALQLANGAESSLTESHDFIWRGHAKHLASVARFTLATGVENDAGHSETAQQDLFSAAERDLEHASEVFARAGNRYFLAEIANTRAANSYYRANYSVAAVHFQRALELFEAADEPEGAMRAAGNLAFVRYSSGRYREAVEAFERAIKFGRGSSTPEVLADILDNSATAHVAAGNSEKALAQFARALTIHRAANDRAGEARSLQGLGSAYLRIGNARAAANFAAQAIAIREHVDRGSSLVASKLLLGAAQRRFAGPTVALATHEAALALAVAPIDKVRAQLELVRDHAALGEWARAERQIAVALELVADDWGTLKPQLLLERGHVELAQSRYAKSRDTFHALTIIGANAGSPSLEADALQGMAESQFRLGQIAAARATNLRAIQVVEKSQLALVNPEFRARLLATRRSVYDLQAALLLDARDRETRPREREALLRGAMAALDHMRPHRIGIDADARRRILDQEDEYLRGEIALRETRLNSGSIAVSGSEGARLRSELAQLRVRFDLREAAPSARPAPTKHELEVGTRPIRDDTAVLVFHVGRLTPRLLILTRDGVIVERLPEGRELNEAVQALERKLRDSSSGAVSQHQLESTLTSVSSLLLPRAVPRDKPRWIIVSDGPLTTVPFGVLTIGAGPYEPLVIRHEIVMAPNIGAALTLASAGDKDLKIELRSAAVFFDPVFDAFDSRLRSRTITSRDAPFGALQRLPGTAREAQSVASSLDGLPVLRFGGFTASRDSALAPAVLDASVLHFATHAIASDDWPHGSGLVLSGIAADGSFRNGFVSTNDLRSRALAAQLVVLSACDTARGEMTASDNVGGLANAFLLSGARNVVASLWQLPDGASAELISDFYVALRTGETVSRALRRAQHLALADERRKRPNNWAGYVHYATAQPSD